MRKRIFSLLLVVAMLVSMTVVPVEAVETRAAEADQVTLGKEVAEAAAQMVFPKAGENQDAQGKYFIADCPACGAKEVSWFARGEGSGHTNNLIEGAAGNHYYLVGDVTQIQKYSAGTTCVHLNGHNATNETANAILYSGSGENELNIMGSGVITGGRTDGNPVVANIYGTNPVLNLYGGTVKKVDIKYPMFALSAGRTLNVYAGATLDGTGTASSTNSAGVYVNGGNLNVYGGKIINGLGTNGGDVYAASGAVTVAGAAVIDQIKVSTATLDIAGLTDGASIGYAATTSRKIADGLGAYTKYLHAYESGGSVLQAKTDNLTYSTPTLTTNSSSVSAYCAVCDATVTWATTGTHRYLPADQTATVSLSGAKTNAGCFHLNGKNIKPSDAKGAIWLDAGNTWNIIGNGTITGTYTSDCFSTLNAYYTDGFTLNLYGGTWKKISTSKNPLFAIGHSSKSAHNLNIYDGTVIDAAGTDGTDAGAIRIRANGVVNMYGGKIIDSTSSKNYGLVRVDAGSFTMHGGTISGGVGNAAAAGNVYVTGGKFTLENGMITGGKAEAYGAGGNVRVAGGEFIMNGGTIADGQTTTGGGNVAVTAGAAQMNGGLITGGQSTSYGAGNLAILNARTFTMNGGTIENGVAAQTGGNVRTWDSASATFLMTGGLVRNGTAPGGGANIYVGHGLANLKGGVIEEGQICLKGDSITAKLNLEGATARADLVLASTGKNVTVTGKSGTLIGKAPATLTTGSTITLTGGTYSNAYAPYRVGDCWKDNGDDTFTVFGATHGEIETVPGRDATCTQDGLTAGTMCKLCGIVEGQQTIPALGSHTPGTPVKENETVQGPIISYDMVTYCTVCKEELSREHKIEGDAPGFQDALQLNENSMGYCPACEKYVEWTALTSDANNALVGGKHYYLAEDAGTSTATFMTMAPTGTACVHLNGHNITCTGGFAVLDFASGASSTVNFMGSGIAATTSNGGQTLTMGNNGKAVLYSGTYKNNGTGPVAYVQTATLVVEKDATILGNNGIKLAHTNGGSDVYINGGNIENVTLAGSGNTLVLAGAPVIGSLTVNANQTLTLGELTEGASIAVTASGVFTKTNANAAIYSKYFIAHGGYEIVVENGALVANKIYAEVTTYTEDLKFIPNTNIAWCAVCGAEKAWTAWNGSSALYPQNGVHYYLSDNVEFTNGQAIWVGGSRQACLHLNGKNLTSTANNAIAHGAAGAVLNVMGTGIVSGNGTYGATIYAAHGSLNLYSGTYTKLETATSGNANVIRLNNSGTLYLGDAVTINDPTEMVSIFSDSSGSSYVIDGATINGILSASGGQNVTLAGDVKVNEITLKVGYKITLGEMTEGANVGVRFTDKGAGEIAAYNANAEDYAKYFFCSSGGYLVRSIEGILTFVVAVGIRDENGQEHWVDSVEAIIKENDYVQLLSDVIIVADNGMAGKTVDLNGFEVTLKGTGSLNFVDSSGDDYNFPAGVVVNNTGSELPMDVTAPNGKRYIALTEGNQYRFHRIEIKLTSLALDTRNGGLFYKASISAGQALSAATVEFGVAYSLLDVPECGGNRDEIYTPMDGELGVGITALSSYVTGIVKKGDPENDNLTDGETPIYANPYVVLDDDRVILADVENAGKAANGHCLKELIQYYYTPNVSTGESPYDKLSDTQKNNLDKFCTNYNLNTWKGV